MTAYELKNIAILNVKGVDFRCVLWGISKTDAVSTVEDGHFWGCSRMGGSEKDPLPKISHAYPAMMKVGSYTLSKEDPKNI